jgi:spore germination protein PC
MQMWQQWQWVPYVRQLQAQLKAQMDQIECIEQTIELLKAELKTCKDQKRIHIDKIEYKFDQLKVEKLDGTMNIGLTPGALEDIALNGSPESISNNMDPIIKKAMAAQEDPTIQPPMNLREEISKELHSFVEKQVPKQLVQLQERTGQLLDEWHRKMIITDLTKQIEGRMDYYLQQMSQGVTVDQLSSIKDSVLFRTQNDIRSALQLYFEKMPKKGGITG